MANTIDILVNYVTKGDDKTKAALTDLAKAVGVVGAAVGAAKAIYEATVAPTIEYAKQIENMAAVTQTGAEETSKLIQVADDARVEYGTLQVAMRNLVKNGIAPSINNLAALSDEYLSIQDPVKRTQFLMEKFGSKAGPEMAKLLGMGRDALLENAAAAEKVGLVMSEQALQGAKDYQASLDALNDSIEGAKIQLGTALIPALDDAIKGTMAYVDGLTLLAGALGSALNPLDDYDKALEEQAEYYENYQTAVKMTDLDLAKLTETVAYADTSMGQYNMAIQNTQQATEDYALAQIDAREKTQELFDSINTNLDNTIAKWLEDLAWMQSGGLELQAQFEALKKAFVENPEDPDIKAQMEELYIRTQGLKVALGEIDSTEAAKNISENLGVSIEDAYYYLDKLRTDIQAPLTLPVNVVYNDPGPTIPGSGSGTSGPGSGNGGKNPPQERAFGGAQFAGMDYLVGENGPELFRPAVPGTVVPNHTVVNQYNLSLLTQQSTGNLQRDFGVMQTFARA